MLRFLAAGEEARVAASRAAKWLHLLFRSSSFFSSPTPSHLALLLQNTRDMPKDNYGNSYDISSSGTNDQGKHYCSRDYGSDASNSNSNSDGSYYYSNSDGSTYYNSGDGYSNYTSPSGQSYQSSGNQK
ncbi:hypothetical protein RTBOTA2_004387 [Rhodotorula toruloides]|nr:hypothetical protein RTBOTA2_004387 [Rhodotorula toruloides]